MPHPAHPQARPSDARGTCARTPAALRLLLALLATVLGHPRAGLRILFGQSAALAALVTAHADPAAAADLWDEDAEGADDNAWILSPADGFWTPMRGWHADCDPSILYVIGPPPNRGMRAHARPHPPARPRTARAPPRPRPPAPKPQPKAGGQTPLCLSASLWSPLFRRPNRGREPTP